MKSFTTVLGISSIYKSDPFFEYICVHVCECDNFYKFSDICQIIHRSELSASENKLENVLPPIQLTHF